MLEHLGIGLSWILKVKFGLKKKSQETNSHFLTIQVSLKLNIPISAKRKKLNGFPRIPWNYNKLELINFIKTEYPYLQQKARS